MGDQIKVNALITDRDKVRQEWAKSKKDLQQDIGILKKWLETQKHLPETPSDNMIEFFLTNCKYSIERTKQNLDLYYTVKDVMPDLFRGVHPVTSKHLDKIKNTMFCVCLPNLTPTLHRILCAKYKDVDADKADICKSMAHTVANIYEVRVLEDLCMGDIYVVDMQHLKFAVLNKLTPTFIKQYATVLEKVHNNRMKQLHFLFAPTFFDVILSMFKSFLSKKLQERIYIHHSLEDLYKFVPQEWLPSDYGGKEKSLDELQELWDKKFLELKDHFDKLENMHVNESLRPEKLTNDDILGYHGNFKKIDVD